MKNQEAYLKAKEKVEARMGFYIHLIVYLLVNTFLTILNLAFSRDHIWVIWPMIGWGAGLIIHGLRTFVFNSGTSLKERLIEKEMQER